MNDPIVSTGALWFVLGALAWPVSFWMWLAGRWGWRTAAGRLTRWRRRHEPPLFAERWSSDTLAAREMAMVLHELVERRRAERPAIGDTISIPARSARMGPPSFASAVSQARALDEATRRRPSAATATQAAAEAPPVGYMEYPADPPATGGVARTGALRYTPPVEQPAIGDTLALCTHGAARTSGEGEYREMPQRRRTGAATATQAAADKEST